MKRITNKTLLILFLMCFGISFVLTGCMPTFDASGYIKACLDANTKGEFETYAEITGATTEEIEMLYNQAIDTEMAYVEGYNLSDEKKEEFRQFFISMYKSFKYEVGEATRNEDGSYTVPVTTYKLMIFDGVLEEGNTYLNNYAQAEVDAGRTPSQEQIDTEAMNYMYRALTTNLEEPDYAEPVTINVQVTPTKNGSQVIYSVGTSELQAIIEALVDIENAQ